MNRVYFRRSFDMHWTDYPPPGGWSKLPPTNATLGRSVEHLEKRCAELSAQVASLQEDMNHARAHPAPLINQENA